MIDENFEYNRKDAFCNFCSRKKNPHPDFDEPIVVRDLILGNISLSICINCHHEIIEQSNFVKGEASSLAPIISSIVKSSLFMAFSFI